MWFIGWLNLQENLASCQEGVNHQKDLLKVFKMVFLNKFYKISYAYIFIFMSINFINEYFLYE